MIKMTKVINSENTYRSPKMKVVEITANSCILTPSGEDTPRKGGAGIINIDGEDDLDW